MQDWWKNVLGSKDFGSFDFSNYTRVDSFGRSSFEYDTVELHQENPSEVEALKLEVNAYRLEFVNRLRQIPMVTDIDMQETRVINMLLCEAFGDTFFKLCGVEMVARHRKGKLDERVHEEIRCDERQWLRENASIVDVLKQWQAHGGDEQEEERFRL